MRLLISLSLLIIVIFSGAIWSNIYIMDTMDNLDTKITTVNKQINRGSWLEAAETMKKLEKEWNKAQEIVPILVDHSELQDLEIALAGLSSRINQQNREEAITEIDIAYRLIKDVKEQEKFALRNIF
ncbi:MAG: DUF4363 family protein [Halanaerobiales bacterium]